MSLEHGDFALAEREAVNQRFGSLDFDAGLVEWMDLSPGLDVLDVACGHGRHARQFEERVRPGRVVGVDRSAELIEQARRGGGAVRFEVAEATRLPFEPHRFDRISCNYAIYHFAQPESALLEMLRVAREKAKIVLTGPAADNNPELYELLRSAGGEVRVTMGRDTYESGIESILRSRGLRHAHRRERSRVRFPTAGELVSYFATTRLFLDNVFESERADLLASAERALPAGLCLTKSIGVFEIWT